MTQEHERFMKIALEEAARGKAEGNLAVGSIIVRNGEVIAKGRNLVKSESDPTAHAETVAIREAGKATGEVDFSGSVLYTTFEPCHMCCGAIMNCGISTVVLGGRPTPSENRWADYTVEKLIAMAGQEGNIDVVTGIYTKECSDIRY